MVRREQKGCHAAPCGVQATAGSLIGRLNRRRAVAVVGLMMTTRVGVLQLLPDKARWKQAITNDLSFIKR